MRQWIYDWTRLGRIESVLSRAWEWLRKDWQFVIVAIMTVVLMVLWSVNNYLELTKEVQTSTATASQSPDWRLEMMRKYLVCHESVTRQEAWWLDVATDIVYGYYEKLIDNGDIPPPSDRVKFWREVIAPELYDDYTLQLPETPTAAQANTEKGNVP
ncbi:MAG: hypothetical protein WC516_01590 [Patescibacteria group bacterium]